MSNDQWSSGQSEPQRSDHGWMSQSSASDAQPPAPAPWPPTTPDPQGWEQQASQSSAPQEWGQPQQQANATQEWGQSQQPTAQGWGEAQPQPSASDWSQGQQQQQWGQSPAPAAAANQGWQQQQPAGGGWQQPAQQGWDQQQQQPWAAQGQPAKDPNAVGFGAVFDFGFKKFALGGAAGTIYLVMAIALGVWWLFGLIDVLTLEYINAGTIVRQIFGNIAIAFFALLGSRVVLEGAAAQVKLLQRAERKDAAEAQQVEQAA
ncbi:MAG: hypothetical protein ACK5KO_13635 [Arachnia sp.]